MCIRDRVPTKSSDYNNIPYWPQAADTNTTSRMTILQVAVTATATLFLVSEWPLLRRLRTDYNTPTDSEQAQ